MNQIASLKSMFSENNNLRKIYNRGLQIIFTIPFIIPILLSRLLRPIIHIRFGMINSARLGHFSGDCALYLAEKKAGLHKGYLDIFYFNSHWRHFQ